jgi:hypothetical protein
MVETIADDWLTINMTTDPAAALPLLEDIQSAESHSGDS